MKKLVIALVLLIALGVVIVKLSYDGSITGYGALGGVVTPQNPVPFKISDTVGAGTDRWVTFGLPIAEGNGLVNANNIRLLVYDGAAYTEVSSDWRVQTTRPANPSRAEELWWVAGTFRADDLVGSRTYYMDYGQTVQRSSPSQPLTVTDAGTYYSVNTGNGHIFEINKAGSVFRRVSVNGQDTIALGMLNGFEVTSSAGTVYSSWNGPQTVTVEHDGDVSTVLKIEGDLWDASGSTAFLHFIARLKIYNDGKVELPFVIQNPGNYDRNINANHRRFKGLEFVVNLNLNTQKQLQLTEFMSPISYTTETFAAYQDFNPVNSDFDALSIGADPTQKRMDDNPYLRIVNGVGTTIYFEQNELPPQTGTRSNGVVAVSDGGRRFAATMEDFWQESPKTIRVQGNTLRLGVFGVDDPAANYLVHDQIIAKTYASNPNQYDRNTFDYASTSSLAQHAAIDEGNYVLHKAIQEYEKILFDFSDGTLNAPEALTFATAAQDPIIAFPDSDYFRIAKASSDRFSYIGERDWANELTDPVLIDAAQQQQGWGRAMWDEAYVTQAPDSSYPLIPTLYNRFIMGTIVSGTFGVPTWLGWSYHGSLAWTPDVVGWLNNGFTTGSGLTVALLRSGDASGFNKLHSILYNNFIDVVYVWGDVTDSIAGAGRHEKGNWPPYGFYQDGVTPYSIRHNQFYGSSLAALTLADPFMKESLLLTTVKSAKGYPHVPYQTVGGQVTIDMSNSIDNFGPAGEHILNLLNYYDLTADDTFVEIAMDYVDAIQAIMARCDALYGYKIIVSPAQNQFVHADGLTSTNGQPGTFTQQYNCNPGSANQIQTFTNLYTFEAIARTLEADAHVNGQYDQQKVDFFVDAFADYYTVFVQPFLPTTPAVGTTYNSARLYNYFNILPVGANPPTNQPSPGSCSINSAVPTTPIGNFTIWVCGFFDTTGALRMGGVVLPWLYYQTGNLAYLNSAEILVRDLILYRGKTNVAYGVESGYKPIAWRNFGEGSADVKTWSPVPRIGLAFWVVKLNLVTPLVTPFTPPSSGGNSTGGTTNTSTSTGGGTNAGGSSGGASGGSSSGGGSSSSGGGAITANSIAPVSEGESNETTPTENTTSSAGVGSGTIAGRAVDGDTGALRDISIIGVYIIIAVIIGLIFFKIVRKIS